MKFRHLLGLIVAFGLLLSALHDTSRQYQRDGMPLPADKPPQDLSRAGSIQNFAAQVNLQLSASGSTEQPLTTGNSETQVPSKCLSDCAQEKTKFSMMLATIQTTPPNSRTGFTSFRGTDFHMSRSGVLIHEECFEVYGQFDIESVVTDTVAQGFTCMAGLEDYARRRHAAMNEREYADGGAALHQHIPRLIQLFSPRESLDHSPINFIDSEGSFRTHALTDPCNELHSFNLFQNVSFTQKDCQFDTRVDQIPKVFCNADEVTKIVLEQRRRSSSGHDNAVATIAETAYPIVKNWKGRTRIYNHPMIAFLPPSHGYDSAKLKSTLWHEIMHNIGYEHDQSEHPDYSYFCQAHCFWDEDASRYLTASSRLAMTAKCSQNSTNNPEDNAYAKDIQRLLYRTR